MSKYSRTPLYPFQKEGVELIQEFGGRALVGDDPGLGKTLSTISWKQKYLSADGPAVVVCPANIKYHWRKELWKHARIHGEVLEGTKPRKHVPSKPAEVYILNYDILKKWTKWLRAMNPALVVLDECHNLQTRSTQRTRAAKRLCRDVPHIIGLSGTAVLSRPAQLWPMLNILDAEYWGTFPEFASQYCELRRKPWGWEYHGATNLADLHKRLKETCLIRRRKADVLKDLPPKTRVIIPIDIESPKEYRAAHTDFIGWLKGRNWAEAGQAERAERLSRTGGLKRLVAELKLRPMIRWVEDYLDNQSDGKLIFFGWHHRILKPFYQHFRRRSVGVDGSVTGAKRQAAVDKFSTDPHTDLFIGQLKATCEGWPGQAASAVAFGELDWVVGRHTQGEDRPHRIGQTGNVTCYYLIARNTIEEQIMKTLERYQGNVSAILDGGPMKEDLTLFTDLMTQLGVDP